MQIERIYQPDLRCQMYAIMLILRIRLPHERSKSVTKEVPEIITQHSPPIFSTKAGREQSKIGEPLY